MPAGAGSLTGVGAAVTTARPVDVVGELGSEPMLNDVEVSRGSDVLGTGLWFLVDTAVEAAGTDRKSVV